MHPEDIKAALRKRHTPPSQIARDLGVSDQTVSLVIRGRTKSARVAERIASVLDTTPDALWPGTYRRAA